MNKSKEKMRNNRRCIIYGCNSTSTLRPDLKFFRFPLPETPEYQIWLSACKDSYNQIRVLKKPLVCSLHFIPEDIGGRRLNPRAYPKIRLVPNKEYADTKDRDRKIKFLDEVIEEWILRNRPYCDIYGNVLIDKARLARDLLDIPNYEPDHIWLQKFNEAISAPGSKLLGKMPAAGDSLCMADVIRDLTQLKQNKSRLSYSPQENSIEISDDDDYDDGDFSDGYADISNKLEVSVTVDDNEKLYEPSSKMPKLQSILLDLDEEEASEKKVIVSYDEAVKYLKPLEDFALQKEDFRAIGLLTQLEALFKLQH